MPSSLFSPRRTSCGPLSAWLCRGAPTEQRCARRRPDRAWPLGCSDGRCPFASLVALPSVGLDLRQTFVRRRHRPTMSTSCCSSMVSPSASGTAAGRRRSWHAEDRLPHRIEAELISALGMGTNLDVAAADQSRPSATRAAKLIHPMRSIFIPHLGKIGLAYFLPSECEVAHTSRGLTSGPAVIKLRPGPLRPGRGRWRVISARPCWDALKPLPDLVHSRHPAASTRAPGRTSRSVSVNNADSPRSRLRGRGGKSWRSSPGAARASRTAPRRFLRGVHLREGYSMPDPVSRFTGAGRRLRAYAKTSECVGVDTPTSGTLSIAPNRPCVSPSMPSVK